jgi:solute carrier family 25 phosphate transporter 23/24/25/41
MVKSNKQTFDNTYSGAQPPPLLPPLRSDPQQTPPEATTLKSYREQEEPQARERRLRALWDALPKASDEVIQWNADSKHPVAATQTDAERIEKLRQIYNQELVNRVAGEKAKAVDYNGFVKVGESSKRAERTMKRTFHRSRRPVSYC